MNDAELALRARIFTAFAATGRPPSLGADDAAALRSLAEQHVVVLDGDGAIVMAHPFAAPRDGATRVEGASGGVTVDEAALFHVAVPARRWWDDIAYT